MSLELEGKSCPACHAYLFDGDDVVYCPVCGAPHHRECYQSLGHCALQEDHGTDKQYDNTTSKATAEAPAEELGDSKATCTCSACGSEYDAAQRSCPNCGAPNISAFGGRIITVNIDAYGGVPADTDIGEGVTAREAVRFTAVNTQRYLPKFAKMAAGFKGSWNWLAFLFPSVWLMTRKLYKQGAFTMALSVAFSMLQLPMLSAVNTMDFSTASNYMELSQLYADAFFKQGPWLILSFVLAVLADFALRIVVGALADRIYYRHTISSVKAIKAGDADTDSEYARRGGVSFGMLLLSFVIVRFLPSIIAGLFI